MLTNDVVSFEQAGPEIYLYISVFGMNFDLDISNIDCSCMSLVVNVAIAIHL